MQKLPPYIITRFQDGVAYQEAVQYAMDNTDPSETLIISTSDHGHAIAYNGYCGRGSPVTGLCMGIDPSATMHASEPNYAADGSTYTVVSVGNGPGSILYEGDEEVGTRRLRSYIKDAFPQKKEQPRGKMLAGHIRHERMIT